MKKIVKLALLTCLVVGVLAVSIAIMTDSPEKQAEREAVKAAEEMERDVIRYQEREKEDAAKRAKVKAEQVAVESLTDEQKIAKAARKAFGDAAVKSVTYVDGINVAMIAVDEPIPVSANSSRKQFLLAVRETVKEIANMPGIKGVDVRWKDGDMRLMELRFEGDAIARAAKATHVDDLTAIAGTYWAHSGF
ncbi:hypothetical protein DCE79_11120 [Lysinibacillus sp. 2017]|uniref:hypothetical protein n=1 Tax=unclassified Lysinibacillus TaxID=2636778 RepID=UPI000D528040|nr:MULTISPECIES: hypothetical protein [unclassified Lysinibacillus]AWE07903.1 hypothetical protein DCE79_11120 [Lysinibacillus sp. 2017]TGN33149.1 hypothetical protein E4L99_15015 [Lysinibacillus sp. S2017]